MWKTIFTKCFPTKQTERKSENKIKELITSSKSRDLKFLIIIYDTSRDQWIKCFDFGELRMVAEGLQNKYQLRRKVGVNRPNTLR